MEKEEKERWQEAEDQKIVDSSSNIVWLSEIGKKDIAIAGGKGANLAELYNIGLSVPPAFIVTAQAYHNFLKNSGIKDKVLEIANSITLENTPELEDKAKKIQKIIIKSEMPEQIVKDIKEAYSNINVDKEALSSASKDVLSIIKVSQESCFVAVRSSATTEDLSTASFAGQQDTFLNINGNEDLINAVKRCWASLFTARAIYYRTKKGFPHEASLIAVIVQKMIDSEKSGVTFTVNPLTNNKEEIVIESVFGLGEGIVSGAVEPDTYILDKKDIHLVSKRLGNKKMLFTRNSQGKTIKKNLPEDIWGKPVLGDYEIKTLANYALKIEEHYKWPQDIEWGIEQGKVYILQSRPVTTIEKEKKDAEEIKIDAEEILKGLAASSGIASGKVKIIQSMDDLSKIQSGDILVTKMTNPDMVIAMQKATAIITNEGGLTAHAAIISREIGLPCVVGTRTATETLKNGQLITVDGTNGRIYEGIVEPVSIIKSATAEAAPEEVKKTYDELKKKKTEELQKTETHESGKKPLVKVNCDLPNVAERAAATNADGVGLVRIEFIIAQGGIHPTEYIKRGQLQAYTKLLANELEKITKAFRDKPVWIRTSDIRTDEYKSLEGADNEPKEDNPMMGWHGIRRGLEQQEILKAEFKAIKELYDRGYKNIGVMIPFLIYVRELKDAKKLAREIGLPKEVKFGVMIETPASCWIIEQLCQVGIDFISFGTNDLTQLTLGIDRNNEKLAKMYNEMHPAVLGQIAKVIETCRHYGVQTSICGQAGSWPKMVKFLARQGITSISANIDAVQLVRDAVDEVL